MFFLRSYFNIFNMYSIVVITKAFRQELGKLLYHDSADVPSPESYSIMAFMKFESEHKVLC